MKDACESARFHELTSTYPVSNWGGWSYMLVPIQVSLQVESHQDVLGLGESMWVLGIFPHVQWNWCGDDRFLPHGRWHISHREAPCSWDLEWLPSQDNPGIFLKELAVHEYLQVWNTQVPPYQLFQMGFFFLGKALMWNRLNLPWKSTGPTIVVGLPLWWVLRSYWTEW